MMEETTKQLYYGLPMEIWLVLAGAIPTFFVAIFGIWGNYLLANVSAKNDRKRLMFEKKAGLFSDFCTYCSKIFGAPKPGSYGAPRVPKLKMTGQNNNFIDNHNEWQEKFDQAMKEHDKEFEQMINVTIMSIHEFSSILFQLELFLPKKLNDIRELQKMLIEFTALWETIKLGGNFSEEQEKRNMNFQKDLREKFISFRDYIISENIILK